MPPNAWIKLIKNSTKQDRTGILGKTYRTARIEVDCNSSKLIFGQDVQKSKLRHSDEILKLSKVFFFFFLVYISSLSPRFSISLLLLQDTKAQLSEL